jgi:hypothetical protein
MAVALITLALSWVGVGRGADAAPPSRCVMIGSIGGPNPAYEGDNVSATVSVGASRGICDANSVRLTTGSWTLCSETLNFGSGRCSVTFPAFRGLSTVTATLSTGQSLRLGTFTVLPRTPTSPAGSPRPTRTITVVPAASRAASSVAAASRSAAAASAARAAATHTRTSTVTSTAFPSDSQTPSTEAAAPTDTPASDTASAGGFSVNVRTDPRGGASIPFGPLLLALLVLAGFVAAAGRLIYTHAHEEIGA